MLSYILFQRMIEISYFVIPAVFLRMQNIGFMVHQFYDVHFMLGYMSKNKVKFQMDVNPLNRGGWVKTDICGRP